MEEALNLSSDRLLDDDLLLRLSNDVFRQVYLRTPVHIYPVPRTCSVLIIFFFRYCKFKLSFAINIKKSIDILTYSLHRKLIACHRGSMGLDHRPVSVGFMWMKWD